jgi:hypothetical protein
LAGVGATTGAGASTGAAGTGASTGAAAGIGIAPCSSSPSGLHVSQMKRLAETDEETYRDRDVLRSLGVGPHLHLVFTLVEETPC